MLWLLVSLAGLMIVILNIRYHYKEDADIKNKKKRGIMFVFSLIISVASESTLLYLGLLIILFGLVKAAGLL